MINHVERGRHVEKTEQGHVALVSSTEDVGDDLENGCFRRMMSAEAGLMFRKHAVLFEVGCELLIHHSLDKFRHERQVGYWSIASNVVSIQPGQVILIIYHLLLRILLSGYLNYLSSVAEDSSIRLQYNTIQLSFILCPVYRYPVLESATRDSLLFQQSTVMPQHSVDVISYFHSDRGSAALLHAHPKNSHAQAEP